MVHSYLQFKSNQAKSSKANLKQSQAKPSQSQAQQAMRQLSLVINQSRKKHVYCCKCKTEPDYKIR